MISDQFVVSAGSVPGFSHRLNGTNNQDAYICATDEKNLVAVVSDGCSSAQDSEVGAKIIARISVEEISRLMREKDSYYAFDILPDLEKAILSRLRDIISDLGEANVEMFLTTIVAIISNDFMTSVISMGDGVISINGEKTIIDEENRPSYIGYKILPGRFQIDESEIKFVVRAEVPTRDISSLLIATDGAKEIEEKSKRLMPVLGKLETAGGLAQFETDPRYLKNPFLLQKRLNQLNAQKTWIDWEKREVNKFEGIMSDDTTIILLRRR